MKKLCVVGLGYIGLPTAAMFATHGFEVVGVDVNDRVVDLLSNGEVHIKEPGLKTLVEAAIKSGKLRMARDPEPSDAFIVAVPTPLARGADGSPASQEPRASEERTIPRADLSCVRAAAESLVPHLRAGNLVVLESTVPPRTVVDLLIPILRWSGLPVAGDGSPDRSGKRAAAGGGNGEAAGGAPVLVAHCPERVLPGRILEELVRNDRVIGGADRLSAEAARELYSTFVEGELLVTDATTAEMVKLMENTYRDVNIALANELSLVAERVGIDIWEAIELANRHPRVNILKPGPGVGGHCIAVDPWFLVQSAPEVASLIVAARRVNDEMPAHVVGMVKRALVEQQGWTMGEKHGKNRKLPASGPSKRRCVVACLGLAYKANVGDTRESPSVEVVRLLREEGFDVRAYDPHVRMGVVAGQVDSLNAAVDGADVVVLLTDHNEFGRAASAPLGRLSDGVLVDCRNFLLADVRGRGRLAVLGIGRSGRKLRRSSDDWSP